MKKVRKLLDDEAYCDVCKKIVCKNSDSSYHDISGTGEYYCLECGKKMIEKMNKLMEVSSWDTNSVSIGWGELKKFLDSTEDDPDMLRMILNYRALYKKNYGK